MVVFPNCKINLGLHVTARRPDGFHDLETCFYPFPLYDALEVIRQPGSSTPIHFQCTGLVLDSPAEDNICVKAYHLLRTDFPTLPTVQMHLHKTIPAGAGLGGGSADGAFALQLLNQKFRLGLSTEQLIDYALKLGSDCPFFILNKPAFATGRGERLLPIEVDLTGYRWMLVNPGIHVNTGWAFSELAIQSGGRTVKEVLLQPIDTWRTGLTNDFEAVVFDKYPEVGEIKEKLYDAGALYASMSGSGSSVYGIFPPGSATFPSFPSHYFVKTI